MEKEDAEFLQAVKPIRKNDNGGLMCIMALLMYYTENEGRKCSFIRNKFQTASKSEIKRAIKWARQAQSSFSAPEDIDGLVSYLLREFI